MGTRQPEDWTAVPPLQHHVLLHVNKASTGNILFIALPSRAVARDTQISQAYSHLLLAWCIHKLVAVLHNNTSTQTGRRDNVVIRVSNNEHYKELKFHFP